MTKEEVGRESQAAEQLDGGITTPHRESSFPISHRSTDRMSTDRVIDKAEKEALKTEKEGATEEPQRDRTLTSVRSPSAERTNGLGGATLPVVEEDGEANSREESIRDEKAADRFSEPSNSQSRPPRVPTKDISTTDPQLPSVPNFNRLSMGFGSSSPTTAEH